MKIFIKSLKKLRNTSLTENEKSWNKEKLIHFMEKHPVRDPEQARQQLQKARTAFGPLQVIYSIRPMTALIAIALVFSLGGGTSLAANNALPGEPLYPVKIHVNERVEGVLALSEEAEAEFNIEKAEIRLQEVEELASKNSVKAGVVTKTEARLDRHIEKIEKLAAKLEAKGKQAEAAAVRARLEAMLEVHSRILTMLQEQLNNADLSSDTEIEIEIESDDNDEEFNEFVAKIKVKATSDDDDNEEENAEDDAEDDENEDRGPSKQAALNAEKLAKKHLDMVLKFEEKKRGKAKADITEEIEIYLEGAEELMVQGEAQLEAESYAEAFASFHQAHKHIQKARSYIASGARIDLRFGQDDDDNEEADEDGEENEDEENGDGDDEDEDEDAEEDEENDDDEDDDDENETELEADVQLNVFGTGSRTEARAWGRF